MAESRRSDVVPEEIVSPAPYGLSHRAHGRLAFLGTAQGGEIVLTHECGGCRVHGVEVQHDADVPHRVAQHRIERDGLADQVAIRTRRRREPGVEVLWSDGEFPYGDLGPEQRSKRARGPVQIELGCLERHHLAVGVDSGIGSAGDGRRDLCAEDRGERRLQLTLDGAHAGVAGVPVEA